MADRIIDTNKAEYSVVGGVLGSTSLDTAALCTHPNVNWASLHKPVRHPDMFASTKAEYANDWWQGKDANEDGYLGDMTCGLVVGNAFQSLVAGGQRIVDKVCDISADVNGFLYKLAKGTTGHFVYLKPQGLSAGSPYRIDDFRGYNHDAINPMPSVESPSNDIYRYKSGIFNASVELPEITLDKSLTNITLDSLKLPNSMLGMTLRSMYYGVLLYSDNLTDVLWATQTAAQKDKELNEGQTPQVTFADNDYVTISNRKGKYKARAFFSSQPLVGSNPTMPSGTTFLLASIDTPIDVAVLDANLPLVSLTLSIKASPRGASCVVNNNQPKSVTLSSCKFDIDNLGLYLEGLSSPATIEPFGHYTVTVDSALVQTFKVQAVVDNITYNAKY